MTGCGIFQLYKKFTMTFPHTLYFEGKETAQFARFGKYIAAVVMTTKIYIRLINKGKFIVLQNWIVLFIVQKFRLLTNSKQTSAVICWRQVIRSNT